MRSNSHIVDGMCARSGTWAVGSSSGPLCNESEGNVRRVRRDDDAWRGGDCQPKEIRAVEGHDGFGSRMLGAHEVQSVEDYAREEAALRAPLQRLARACNVSKPVTRPLPTQCRPCPWASEPARLQDGPPRGRQPHRGSMVDVGAAAELADDADGHHRCAQRPPVAALSRDGRSISERQVGKMGERPEPGASRAFRVGSTTA